MAYCGLNTTEYRPYGLDMAGPCGIVMCTAVTSTSEPRRSEILARDRYAELFGPTVGDKAAW